MVSRDPRDSSGEEGLTRAMHAVKALVVLGKAAPRRAETFRGRRVCIRPPMGPGSVSEEEEADSGISAVVYVYGE